MESESTGERMSDGINETKKSLLKNVYEHQ